MVRRDSTKKRGREGAKIAHVPAGYWQQLSTLCLAPASLYHQCKRGRGGGREGGRDGGRQANVPAGYWRRESTLCLAPASLYQRYKRGRGEGREGGREGGKQTYPQALGGKNQSCALPQPVSVGNVPATQLLQISPGDKEFLEEGGREGGRERGCVSISFRRHKYHSLPSLFIPPSLPPSP